MMPMGPYKFYPCMDKDKKGHTVTSEQFPMILCHDCQLQFVVQEIFLDVMLISINRENLGHVFLHVRRSI